MNMVSLPISQNPKWYIWRRANFPGPPAKPWYLGLLLTKSQSQPGLTKCEADLSLLNMRFSQLNTTWNSYKDCHYIDSYRQCFPVSSWGSFCSHQMQLQSFEFQRMSIVKSESSSPQHSICQAVYKHLKCITSFNPYKNSRGRVCYHAHVTEEESAVLRDKMTCPSSHSQL